MESSVAQNFFNPIKMLDSFTQNFSRRSLSFKFLFCFAVEHDDLNLQNKFWLLFSFVVLCRCVPLKVKLMFFKIQNKIQYAIMSDRNLYSKVTYILIYIYMYIYIYILIYIYINIYIYTYIYTSIYVNYKYYNKNYIKYYL